MGADQRGRPLRREVEVDRDPGSLLHETRGTLCCEHDIDACLQAFEVDQIAGRSCVDRNRTPGAIGIEHANDLGGSILQLHDQQVAGWVREYPTSCSSLE